MCRTEFYVDEIYFLSLPWYILIVHRNFYDAQHERPVGFNVQCVYDRRLP